MRVARPAVDFLVVDRAADPRGVAGPGGGTLTKPVGMVCVAWGLAAGLRAVAKGPRSARATRQTMLRKVVLEHHGNVYDGTIRNISTSGALIEGLWNVPVGTIFKLQISANYFVTCTTRWCVDERMGVEFANPLQRDDAGQITAVQSPPPKPVAPRPTERPPIAKAR